MIGVWTGCGFSTVCIISPPRDILGYDACVSHILDPEVHGDGVLDVQGPAIPDGDIPFVIIIE